MKIFRRFVKFIDSLSYRQLINFLILITLLVVFSGITYWVSTLK